MTAAMKLFGIGGSKTADLVPAAIGQGPKVAFKVTRVDTEYCLTFSTFIILMLSM